MNEKVRYANVRPTAVMIDDGKLWVTLKDGRVIATPLDWYPWLAQATLEQQKNIELLPDGVYWNDLDEGLEVEGMLRGIRPYTPENNALRDSEQVKIR
jgi:hypothetical protein